jgi:membrane associated rhomboid family serine protease
MFSSIWDDLKREFEYGNVVSRIIIVNVLVFLFWIIARLILLIFVRGLDTPTYYFEFLQNFEVSSNWLHNFTHPWVLLTYMFTHIALGHIVFNMLAYFMFGKIVGDLIGDKHILPIYIWGGLLGGVVFILSFIYFKRFDTYALGASASVTATAMAAGLISPNYLVRLIIFGEVQLKYIVAVFLVLDLISISMDNNSGGHIAHLGGALMGYLYISALHNGRDYGVPIRAVERWCLNFGAKIQHWRHPKPKVTYRNKEKINTQTRSTANTTTYTERPSVTRNQKAEQAKIDAILEKIKQSGYENLTPEEKELLVKASKN